MSIATCTASRDGRRRVLRHLGLGGPGEPTRSRAWARAGRREVPAWTRCPGHTTDYVVDETLTLIRARAGVDTALAWGDAFFGLTALGRITLEPIDPGRLQAAWRLFRRYRELDRLSFTDCASFAVMHEMSTLEVFSADRHFEQAGMGFRCLC